MKRINFLYLSVILVFVALLQFNWRYGKETVVFFGFAENKETEINLEHPVEVNKVYVQPGQKVFKGDLLLEVTRSSLGLKLNNLNHEIAELHSQQQVQESELTASISQLYAQRAAKVAEFNQRIEQLEAEMALNQSLIKDLKSISPSLDKGGVSPNKLKIASLRKQLRLAVHPIDSQIRKLRKDLKAAKTPLKIQTERLEEELQFVQVEEDKLSILAPRDGVVGSLFCKGGENISAFSTLLTFYEQNPTVVKGFVHESLIVHVNQGDSVLVNSSLHPEVTCRGKVVGLGSRIVEIPERLRKMPALKTYGREVIIEIPPSNYFLQKEKVVLNLFPSEKSPSGFLQAFTGLLYPSKELTARQ